MNIHEYQAKALLKEFGAPVLRGKAVYSVDEAAAAQVIRRRTQHAEDHYERADTDHGEKRQRELGVPVGRIWVGVHVGLGCNVGPK